MLYSSLKHLEKNERGNKKNKYRSTFAVALQKTRNLMSNTFNKIKALWEYQS